MRSDFHMLRGDARKLVDHDAKKLLTRNDALKKYLDALKSGIPLNTEYCKTLKKFTIWLILQVEKSNEAIKRATKQQSSSRSSRHSTGSSHGSAHGSANTPASVKKAALPVSGGRKTDKKTK